MKKIVVSLTIVTLLAFSAVAYAHGTGWRGGHMDYGYGYGGHMMEPGYGGHMYGWRGNVDQKFFDETVDIRKELHNKKFEYFEATRNPKTDTKTITKLEKEIRELQEKLFEKTPKTAYRGYGGGYGCW